MQDFLEGVAEKSRTIISLAFCDFDRYNLFKKISQEIFGRNC